MGINIDNLAQNFENSELNISLNGNLNKNEREFLNIIVKIYAHLKDLEISLDLKEIQSRLDLDWQETVYFLEKLSKKSFSYSIKIDKDFIEGSFNIISSFCLYNNKILISLPKELESSNRINGLFKILKPEVLYNFNCKISIYFYGYFLKNFITKKDFEIDYEKLKEILHITQKYERFFDFEKNILKKLMEDLEKKFNIKYEKNKIGSFVNNKVISVSFLFQDQKILNEDILNIKNILFLIKNDIKDISEVYTLLKNSIEIYGYEITYKTCLKAKERYSKTSFSFDTFLKLCIEKLRDNNLAPTILVKEKFNSIQEFKKRFVKELEKIKPDILFDTSFFSKDFLKGLYLLNSDKILEFENSEIRIILYWRQNNISTIKIYSL